MTPESSRIAPHAQQPPELWTLCLWLALLPLPLGAARTWALALVLPPLFALGLVVAWRRRRAFGASLPAVLVRPPGLWLLLFLGLLVVQLVPLGDTPVSVAPHRTLLYLLVALGCAVLFWLAVALVRSDDDLKLLLYALVACGTLQAGVAVFLLATHTPLTLVDSTIQPGQATGTFMNRNHLAAYLNMCMAAGIGLLMGQLAGERSERSWRQRLRDWIELLLGGKARLLLLLLLVLVLMVMVIALILTRSRMGNASFFFGLLAAASVYAMFARRRRRGLMLFVASVLVIDLVLIGAWVGVDRVVQRVQDTPLMRQSAGLETTRANGVDAPGATPETGSASQTPADASGTTRRAAPPRVGEESVEERAAPALEALPLLRDHFWLGTGAGTFYLVFMQYAPPARVLYNHAHNDYLEIATDAGVLGLLALLGLAASSLLASLKILRHRRNQMARAAAFAALMALACLAMHSMVDFNLQIPANAMMLSLMAALPFAARNIPSARHRHASDRGGGAHGLDAVRGAEHGEARGAEHGKAAAHHDRRSRSHGRRHRGTGAGALRGTLSRGNRALIGVALASVATLVLVWGIWTAGRFGLADHLSRRVDQRIALLAAQGTPPSAESLRAVQAMIAPAILAAPEVSGYYETLGAAWFASGEAPDRSQEQRQADFREAVAQFREAARRSRASGYAWGDLMLAKHRAGEIDDEFHEALRKAVRHAPYEPNVQVMVVEAGLRNWTRLRGDERRLVLLTLQRGWPANAAGFLREAAAVPEIDEWCIDTGAEAQAFCEAVRERVAKDR